MPPEKKSTTGYVNSYKIDIIENHDGFPNPFLVVTLTKDENGTVEPDGFVIFRDKTSDSVNEGARGYWAVSYSNLIQAIIATIKEAYIHREKVIIEYIVPPSSMGGHPMPGYLVGKKLIKSIQITR